MLSGDGVIYRLVQLKYNIFVVFLTNWSPFYRPIPRNLIQGKRYEHTLHITINARRVQHPAITTPLLVDDSSVRMERCVMGRTASSTSNVHFTIDSSTTQWYSPWSLPFQVRTEGHAKALDRAWLFCHSKKPRCRAFERLLDLLLNRLNREALKMGLSICSSSAGGMWLFGEFRIPFSPWWIRWILVGLNTWPTVRQGL